MPQRHRPRLTLHHIADNDNTTTRASSVILKVLRPHWKRIDAPCSSCWRDWTFTSHGSLTFVVVIPEMVKWVVLLKGPLLALQPVANPDRSSSDTTSIVLQMLWPQTSLPNGLAWGPISSARLNWGSISGASPLGFTLHQGILSRRAPNQRSATTDSTS